MLKLIQAFCNDRGGNFAILTVLAFTPVVAGCGIALDYARAFNKKTEIQNVADAAVRYAASAGETDTKKIKKLAESMFLANITDQFRTVAKVESVDVDEDNHITMKVRSIIPLSIARMIQPEGLQVGIISQAVMGSDDKIEVALVLDNTYSMYGQKLTDLKTASNALLSVFEKVDKKKTKVRLSITPFAQYVNVGVNNRGKSWLDVPADSKNPITTCSMQKPVISQTCTTSPTTTTIDGVTVPSTTTKCTNQVYGPEKEVCSIDQNAKTWTGCVGSRTTPLNVIDSTPSKPYPGLQNTTCTNAITTLTNDYKVLRAAVTAMSVSTGSAFQQTYIPQGVLWGWNTISPAEPFNDALAYEDDVQKFIVIMTDGTNTVRPKDSDYSLHNAKDKLDKADTFVEQTCSNAKAAYKEKPITIYTVAVGVAKNSSTALALAKCASDGSKAYFADDSAKLAKTFEEIAIQIMKPRLTM